MHADAAVVPHRISSSPLTVTLPKTDAVGWSGRPPGLFGTTGLPATAECVAALEKMPSESE